MLICAATRQADAHPHTFIDLKTTVVLNDQGGVIAIEQEWLFDEFYTQYALEGFATPHEGKSQQLTELARINLDNLRPYDYFTELSVNGTKAKLGSVSEFETELRGGRIWMRFLLPIEKAINPKIERMRFSIFDPTYYTQMLHVKENPVTFRGAKQGGCVAKIIPPNPKQELVLFAAALDKGAEPDKSLGAHFAETVEVPCQ